MRTDELEEKGIRTYAASLLRIDLAFSVGSSMGRWWIWDTRCVLMVSAGHEPTRWQNDQDERVGLGLAKTTYRRERGMGG